MMCTGCAWEEDVQDRVVRVVDGDTVILEELGRARLIGVDAPESVRPDFPVEYFGPEAAAFAQESLDRRRVRIRFESERKDSHGRFLVYLFLDDGTLFNAELIKQGYAFAYTRFPFAFKTQFLEYEDSSRRLGKGMWERSVWKDATAVFHGNQRSLIYHAPGCEHFNCSNCTVNLESRTKAETQGFRPHEKCVLSAF
jgi:micrococcal nuclease